jgi:hypothetical protein
MQAEVIRRAATDHAYRDSILQLNSHVANASRPTGQSQAAEYSAANRRIIAERYSLSAVGERLGRIYQHLLMAAPGPVVRDAEIGAAVLGNFVSLQQLFLVRLEEA